MIQGTPWRDPRSHGTASFSRRGPFKLLIVLSFLACAWALDAGDAFASVWAGPVRDAETGQVDAAVDEPFAAAVRMIEARDWHAGPAPAGCSNCQQVSVVGHHGPATLYTLELRDHHGSVIRRSQVNLAHDITPYDLAQALVLDCLFLTYQADQNTASPQILSNTRSWTVGMGPSGTFSPFTDMAVAGSELAVSWRPKPTWEATLAGSFEAFGRGSNALGRYQYRLTSATALVDRVWERNDWRFSVGGGVRLASYEFEFQTHKIGESRDASLFAVGDVRLQRRLRDVLLVGFAVRPQFAFDASDIGLPDDQDVYAEPHFSMQMALTVAVEM